MAKGSAAERQLSNQLEDEYDYAAMPAGGSGSGTQRPRPDVFAVRGVRLETHTSGLEDYSNSYAIECKAWSSGTGQFTCEEIEQLEAFADRAGATSLVAVKPDCRRSEHDSWYLREASLLHETPEGNYSLRKQDWPDCQSINEVFGQ
jgi:Holliday junction resolvase